MDFDHLTLNTALMQITDRADHDKRAPLNIDIVGGAKSVSNLIRRGDINTEIYGRNWRVIIIVKTGKRTKECPHGGKPYHVSKAA